MRSTTYKIGGAISFLAIAFIGGAITIDFLPETADGSGHQIVVVA